MYTSDILARLQAGESIEEIGRAFADALNEANDQFQKKNKVEAQKLEIATRILDSIFEYIELTNPELLDYFTSTEDDYAETVAYLDKMLPLIGTTLKFCDSEDCKSLIDIFNM